MNDPQPLGSGLPRIRPPKPSGPLRPGLDGWPEPTNGIDGRTPEQREAAEATAKATRALAECGIGRRFQNCYLHNWTPRGPGQEAALATVRAYAESDGPREGKGLCLLGPPAVGKTHLLAAILRKCARDGLGIMYLSLEDLFLRLRESYGRVKGASTRAVLLGLVKPLVLCLDDLYTLPEVGRGPYRDLWTLLDWRYADCRATLTASNHPFAVLKGEGGLDDRTARRFEAEAVEIPQE